MVDITLCHALNWKDVGPNRTNDLRDAQVVAENLIATDLKKYGGLHFVALSLPDESAGPAIAAISGATNLHPNTQIRIIDTMLAHCPHLSRQVVCNSGRPDQFIENPL